MKAEINSWCIVGWGIQEINRIKLEICSYLAQDPLHDLIDAWLTSSSLYLMSRWQFFLSQLLHHLCTRALVNRLCMTAISDAFTLPRSCIWLISINLSQWQTAIMNYELCCSSHLLQCRICFNIHCMCFNILVNTLFSNTSPTNYIAHTRICLSWNTIIVWAVRAPML